MFNPSYQGRAGWRCNGKTPVVSMCTGSSSSWGGVTCDSGDVKSISLAGLNLLGTIPDSVGYLSRLLSLVLNSNAISGTIPTSFGQLSVITTLKFDSNALTGTVPSALCVPKSLSYLSFSANRISCYASCLNSVSNLLYVSTPPCTAGMCSYFFCPLPILLSYHSLALSSKQSTKLCTVQSNIRTFCQSIVRTFCYSVIHSNFQPFIRTVDADEYSNDCTV